MTLSPFFVRTATYFCVFVSLLFFERSYPFVRSEQKKWYRIVFHLGLSVANSILLFFTLGGLTYALVASAQRHPAGLVHLLGLNGPAEILATVIVFDCWDYWMHRANHRIETLWRFHKAHHTDLELDVTTASRFHIGELLISGGSKCLMILLWGPSVWGLAAFDALLTASSQFHHSNLFIPLRMQDTMERLVVTPRMHRCHHALHRDCLNTNFSSILVFWDRFFGSYHWAREKDELDPVGVFKPRGPVTMQLGAFLLTPIQKLH